MFYSVLILIVSYFYNGILQNKSDNSADEHVLFQTILKEKFTSKFPTYVIVVSNIFAYVTRRSYE